MRGLWLVVLVLGLAAGVSRAEEGGAALPACEPYSPASDVFNPEGDLAQRLASLAKMEAAPESFEPHWLLGLGALYRLGRDHPASLVDQDLAKARRYLEESAMRGQVEASASLAELELAAGQPMQAMMWAQVFVKAMRVRDAANNQQGYPAHLLRRVQVELPANSREEQARQLSEFMRVQGEKFRSTMAMAKVKAAATAPTCRAVNHDWPIRFEGKHPRPAWSPGRGARGRDPASSGFTMFHLTVAPDGSVTDLRVAESVPTASMALQTDYLARHMRFNAVDPAAPPRQALLPLSLDLGEARLRD